MARTESNAGQHGVGFEGEVTGMGLADVLQVNAHNRFSGSVLVRNGESTGVVYFHDGVIVHAEQGAATGEGAVLEILQWTQGRFSMEQNVVSARRTITKSCEHLILEAHRRLDERTNHWVTSSLPAPPSPPPAPPAASRQPAALTELVRTIPLVTEAVLVTGDGQCIGDTTFASETMAGQAAYLVMFCEELGALFRTGEVRSAAVVGANRRMLLYASKSRRFLSVFARPDAEIGAVDADIRRMLTKGR